MSLASEVPSRTTERLMEITWAWPTVILLLFFVLLPIYGPLMPVIEGQFLPVTSKVVFKNVTPVEGGLSVRMQFEKLRDCEFLGVTADRDGISVDFEPINGGLPITLPAGDRLSRPWLLGSTDLEGIRLRFTHRCGPWWITVTVGYP